MYHNPVFPWRADAIEWRLGSDAAFGLARWGLFGGIFLILQFGGFFLLLRVYLVDLYQ